MECPPFYEDLNMYKEVKKEMKDWRPQVILGMLVLGLLGYIAMLMGYDTIAGVCAAGVVSAVTHLTQKEPPTIKE